VKIFLWKRLWTCPKTDYGMKETVSSMWKAHLHHFQTIPKIKCALTARNQLVSSAGYRLGCRGIEVCFPEGTETFLLFAVSR
jgi:hypothetical protein